MKYAAYVEGRAEMLLVADILRKYSNYNQEQVGFQCITLVATDSQPVPYPIQGDESAEYYYQIVNVNNDSLVVSKMKRDIPRLIDSGFEVIVGLRDVYSSDYCSLCHRQDIDRNLIEHLHRVQSEQIHYDGARTGLHFAIMEFEAWMLALLDNYLTSKGVDPNDAFEAVGLDHDEDFENTVFHPSNVVKKILPDYGKHDKNYLSFLSSLGVSDYEALRHSGRCASFNLFMDSLLNWM